ncbi:S1 family peptidase [Amycolatopsis sp. NPDC059657]|uniref:S1 family peptidase n=1 Tax=Amycolatopsis sp. NPDC059657 TaxID=3346899 RepID=UPI00366B5EFF
MRTRTIASGLAAAALLLAGQAAPAAATAGAEPYIIGGHEATGNTSWVAALNYDAPAYGITNKTTCTGTVLFRGKLVTAAHCVQNMPPQPSASARMALISRFTVESADIPVEAKSFFVRASKDRAAGGETARVVRIDVHPGWQWGAGAPDKPVDDVAVLTLDHELDLQTIQLASAPANPGDRVVTYGWGIDAPDGTTLPRALQQIEHPALRPEKCSAGFISKPETCLGNPHGTDGLCRGDSGGPSVVLVRGVPKFVGITSRGTAECGTGPDIVEAAPFYRKYLYYGRAT